MILQLEDLLMEIPTHQGKFMFGPLNLDVCSNIMKHEEFDILEFDEGW